MENAARLAADTARRARARMLNVRIIPRLRLAGIVVWLVLMCVWELAQDQTLSLMRLTPLIAILLGYVTLRWLILERFLR